MSLEIIVVCLLVIVNLLWTQLVCTKVTRIQKWMMQEKYKRHEKP